MHNTIKNIQNIRSYITLNNFVILLVFLFPITAATVKNAGDLIMFTLLVVGMVTFRFSDLKLLDKDKYIFWGFLALFLVGALSMINTENTVEGLKRLERLAGFPLSIFIYMYIIKNRLYLVNVLISGLMISAIVMAWQAWYQVEVLSYVNAIGAYHKIIFGDVTMLVAVMLMVAVFFQSRSVKEYVLFATIVLVVLYASLLSNTRGAWILLPILIGLISINLISSRRISIKSVAMLIMFALILIIIFNSDYIYQRFTSELIRLPDYYNGRNDSESNFQWRIVVWKMALKIWENNVFIGTGLGDFSQETINLLKSGYMDSKMSYVADHAHSMYFDSLATMGILGLFIVLSSIIFIPLIVVRKMSANIKRDSHIFFMIALVIISFSVFGLSESLLSRKSFINFYLFYLIVLVSVLRYNSGEIARNCDSERILFVNTYSIDNNVKFVTVLLLVVFFCFVAIHKVSEIVGYDFLSAEGKMTKDLLGEDFNRKVFVISHNADISKKFLNKNNISYVITSDERMPCYQFGNSLFIYDYNINKDLIMQQDVPGNKENFFKIYSSGESQKLGFIVSDKSLADQCRLKYMDYDSHDFVRTNLIQIGHGSVSMYSNGYVLSPLYISGSGENVLKFDFKSTCVNKLCGKVRLEVFRLGKSNKKIKILNRVVQVGEFWESMHFNYNVSDGDFVYFKLSFINDYYDVKTSQDINMFIKYPDKKFN